MATFNLHTVINFTKDAEAEVAKAVEEFHKVLASLGLSVTKSTLTSDSGQKDVTPVQAVEAAVKPVEAAVESVSSALKSTLDTA